MGNHSERSNGAPQTDSLASAIIRPLNGSTLAYAFQLRPSFTWSVHDLEAVKCFLFGSPVSAVNMLLTPNASSSSSCRSSVRDRWRKEWGKRSLKLIREATSIFKRDFPGRVWGSTAVLIFLEAHERANRSFPGR